MDNAEGPPLVQFENQITVVDHGRLGSPFPRPLSQYLSPEVAARLLNPRYPRLSATLDAEISSTDAIIVALKALSIFKRQERNLYIPISNLPPEILGEIFLAATNNNAHPGFTEPLTSSTAMTLGRVCSRWRQVAWNLPRLWSNMYCCISHPVYSKKEAEIIHSWLARAKGLPLTIRLDFDDEPAWAGKSAPRDIIITLRRFSRSWDSFQIVLPEAWYRPLRYIHQLERLTVLGIRPINAFYFNQKLLRGFYNAPNLSVLRYDCIYLDRLDIHWINITKAMIGGPALDEALEFLRICPSITYFHLVNPTEARGAFFATHVNQLFLEELYLTIGKDTSAQGVGTPISANTVINLLTTPVLRKISLVLPEDVDDPLPHISNLIRRSNCPLATVKVFGPDLGQDSVIYLLSDSQPVLQIINH